MRIWDLITEDHDGILKLSLGRVSFWMMFGVSLYLAVKNATLDPTIISVLFSLLAYGGFKKVINSKVHVSKNDIENTQE